MTTQQLAQIFPKPIKDLTNDELLAALALLKEERKKRCLANGVEYIE